MLTAFALGYRLLLSVVRGAFLWFLQVLPSFFLLRYSVPRPDYASLPNWAASAAAAGRAATRSPKHQKHPQNAGHSRHVYPPQSALIFVVSLFCYHATIIPPQEPNRASSSPANSLPVGPASSKTLHRQPWISYASTPSTASWPARSVDTLWCLPSY